MHGKLFKKLFALFVLFGMPLAACSTSSGNNNNGGYYPVNPTPSPSTTYTPESAIKAVCQLMGTSDYQSDGQGGYYTEAAWQASQTTVSQVKSSVSQIVPSGFNQAYAWQNTTLNDGTAAEVCEYVSGSVNLDYVVYQYNYQGTTYIVLDIYAYSNGGGGGGGGGGQTSYTTLTAIQAVCQLMGTSDYESDGEGGYYVGKYWEASQVTVSQVKSSVSQIVPTGFSQSSSWQSATLSDGTACEFCTYYCGDVYLDYVVYQMTYQGTSYVVLQVYSYTDSGGGGGGGGGGSSSYTTLTAIQWVADALDVSYYSADDYYYVLIYTNYSSSSVSNFKSLVTGSLIPPSFSLTQSWQNGTFSDGTAYEACYYICDSVVLCFTIYNETYEGSQVTVLEVVAFYNEQNEQHKYLNQWWYT